MSLTYATFTTALANFLVMPITQPEFVSAIPNIIDDAEQRIYRELDLLSTVTGAVGTLSIGGQVLFLPPSGSGEGPFVVVQDVRVVTPIGADPSSAGKSTPLLSMAKEMLMYLYADNTVNGVPQYFAMFNQASILIGPRPDAAYNVLISGTVRPLPLSVSNPATFLSTYLPDVFLNAALSIGAGYLKDFGAATDDPQSGVTWEKKYQTQLKSAATEEVRKKSQDQGWNMALKRKELG